MSVVTPQILHYIQTQSWIRRMFESANELKQKHGADNVFDFSLGNPDVPPPENVCIAIEKISQDARKPLTLGYCPNAGHPQVREVLAGKISSEQQTKVPNQFVIVTSGAAGALNTIFRTILSPGDQVVCFAPYFVEYGFYVGNFSGELFPVKSREKTFEINFESLEKAINAKTRAVIINSPNNPTGVVYSEESLKAVAQLLSIKSGEYGKPIVLVSDEPYRFLAFDDVVPPIFPYFDNSIVVSSFSKSLSLAGERIGYIAVNPKMKDAEVVLDGLVLSNRILGFVNAPIIGQRIILEAFDTQVDLTIYKERREVMAFVLKEAGIQFTKPKGAFYFFPQTPQNLPDVKFVDLLLAENIIAVPGTGFGYPGYFRLAYCVDKSIITNSLPAWKRVMNKL